MYAVAFPFIMTLSPHRPLVVDYGPLSGTVTTKVEVPRGPSDPRELATALLTDPLVTAVAPEDRARVWGEWLGLKAEGWEQRRKEYVKLCEEHMPSEQGDKAFKEVGQPGEVHSKRVGINFTQNEWGT